MARKKAPEIDWRERVRADVAALPARRVTDRPSSIKAQTDFLIGGYGLVLQAAKARRVSLPAYIRRAAYAMACCDLGIPLAEVLQRDPRMSRETGLSISDPQGDKFGPWEIEKLVGEEGDDESGTAGR